jgi:hypothetical protein
MLARIVPGLYEGMNMTNGKQTLGDMLAADEAKARETGVHIQDVWNEPQPAPASKVQFHILPICDADKVKNITGNWFISIAGIHVGRAIQWRGGTVRLFHAAIDDTGLGVEPMTTDFSSRSSLRAYLS